MLGQCRQTSAGTGPAYVYIQVGLKSACLGAGHSIPRGGGMFFFVKKYFFTKLTKKNSLLYKIWENFFVNLCVRKKYIVDSQQIFPNLRETAKKGKKISRFARSNV